jgi:hypothetical protein
MKKLLYIFLALGLTLSACGTAPTQPAPPAQTGTPTITPTATQTPTSTITPLPTIPTFTPTFDVSTIVTVTPAEKAECPKENPNKATTLEFEVFPSGEMYVDHPTIEIIQRFLNSGGDIEDLKTGLVKANSDFVFQDITNDGISDFVITSGSAFQIINILYCNEGQYKMFPKDDVESEALGSDAAQFTIQDLNQNGMPDIVSIGNGKTGLEINVLEWSGETFINLTELGAWMPGAGVDGFQLIDLDGNNIAEIVLKGMPNYWYYPGEPLRGEIDIYQWDGEKYSQSKSFTTPEYRFQAIQDGDHLSNQGKFEEAPKWYQLAITSKSLDWWSKEKFENSRDSALNFSTPTALLPDVTEYPSLAAYAYYRIMLLHLVQGQEAEAASTYQTLQDTFGSDQYAAPYVEIATAFWEAYQSTQRMYDGCAAAIQYAVEHPQILTPLGSGYHGRQSHTYEPADVCPFR